MAVLDEIGQPNGIHQPEFNQNVSEVDIPLKMARVQYDERLEHDIRESRLQELDIVIQKVLVLCSCVSVNFAPIYAFKHIALPDGQLDRNIRGGLPGRRKLMIRLSAHVSKYYKNEV